MNEIYSEGKIIFTSTINARLIQKKLLKAGYKFEGDNQKVRPGAYGIMWRRVWEKGGYVCTWRTAGNIAAFKAYGAHKKESIYADTRQVYNNVAGRTKVFENCQAEQRKTTEIVFGIFDYLLGLNIGYDFTARRTKKGLPIRVATWTAFAYLLHELHPSAKPWQVHRAIKARYTNAPENKKLKELLATRRPEGLPIGAIKI